ncbi:chondroitin AC/alginate lyase [Penicillium riverlandense]|uniref:chondroitin AC/alginate lyase n=1 Tax=Penicillium riverlandense TaxID=1903569 RepID=UPI0025494C10|nr:chondroitin AC/alginate lyase [Penicillium riverlandense]KAJ5833379.1 chondroitin AC/alginate lyase [Penicillium riverlandense]
MASQVVCVIAILATVSRAFVHPGLLHTDADFERISALVVDQSEPWYTDWQLMLNNSHCQSTYTPNPQSIVYRGYDGTHAENYQALYNDAAAAYQLALRWRIGNDSAYGDAAANVLNAWASTLTDITGTSDAALAVGIYGYQLANAAEILRSYSGWSSSDQSALASMFDDVFVAESLYFLNTHYGQDDVHFFANWDICNLAAMMAIGVFNDNQTLYDYALNYALTGPSTGALPRFDIANFTESGTNKPLVEGQEAGRDQGHATLDFALYGVLAQQAYNQGDDIFAAYNNEILAASEYCSKYNVGQDVPFTAYSSDEGNFTEVASGSRYAIRPGFELIYAHYAGVKGMDASWTGLYRDMVNGNSTDGVEGGGGDYGGDSGGYDGLGYGTLLYRLS